MHYNTSIASRFKLTRAIRNYLFSEMCVAKVKILFIHYITTCYKGQNELDRVPVSWLSLNVCTTQTDGHEYKAFWCGTQHRRGSAPPNIMHGQGRWGPWVNNLVRNCATVRLLAGHRVLCRSCLNFSTSKLLRCPPICQLSQDSLPIRCYLKQFDRFCFFAQYML